MLTIVNLFSIYVLVQKLLNYYPTLSTRRLYFGEVETPYGLAQNTFLNTLETHLRKRDKLLFNF